MSAIQELTLGELRRHAVETLRHGGGSRPDVLLIRVGNESAVLKDYAPTDKWYRQMVARFVTRRELRALRVLEGVSGVPKLLRVIKPDAFLMEYLPGTNARGYSSNNGNSTGVFPESFFTATKRMLDEMHARGIAHCDLRSRGNLLVSAEGSAVALDFVAHYRRGSRWNPLDRWLFNQFCQADRNAVAKLKQRYAPHLLTQDESASLDKYKKSPLERIARVLGRSARWLVKTILTKEKNRKNK